MPEKKTIERARKKRRAGYAPSTQAGEFVREELSHAKRGKPPVKSSKQTVAIGLSKARRAGVEVPPRGGANKARRKAKPAASAGPKRGSAGSRRRRS